MKKIVLFLCLLLGSFSVASGHTLVNGYVTKNGAFVAPHFRTDRDNTMMNNFSTKGNYNPYTGKKGTKRAKW